MGKVRPSEFFLNKELLISFIIIFKLFVKKCSLKGARKDILLAPEVNFTIISQTAFTWTDPKSAKRQLSHECLFALWRFVHVITVCKILVKLTTGLTYLLWFECFSLLSSAFTPFFLKTHYCSTLLQVKSNFNQRCL